MKTLTYSRSSECGIYKYKEMYIFYPKDGFRIVAHSLYVAIEIFLLLKVTDATHLFILDLKRRKRNSIVVALVAYTIITPIIAIITNEYELSVIFGVLMFLMFALHIMRLNDSYINKLLAKQLLEEK